MTHELTTPTTRGVTLGAAHLGDLKALSTVRATIVGQDIQYPPGTSLRKTLRGYNFGNYGTVSSVADAQQAITDGATVVRVVSNNRWFGPYGVAGTDGRDDNCFASYGASNWALLKDIVLQLVNAGIWVILVFDSDCAVNGGMQDGPGGTDATFCEAAVLPGETPMTMAADGTWTVVGGTWASAGGYNMYTSPVLFGKVRTIWAMAAREFRSYPRILCYELASEPLSGAGFDYLTLSSWNTRLQNALRIIISDVRAADPVTPFGLGGRGGYGKANVGEVILTERTDCMYTWDILSNGASVPGGLPANFDTVCAAAASANVPLFLNQMGTKDADDPSYHGLNAAFAIANARGIITTLWQNKDKGTSSNQYGIRYSDGASGYITKAAKLAAFTARCTESLASLEAAAQAAATAAGAILFYVKPDFSNVFQDNAGTTPVTAVGQTVGLMNPAGTVTGLTLSQATALNRPTLIAAAASYLVDQRPVLSFDGVNTYLSGSSTFYTDTSGSGDDMTVIASCIPGTGAVVQDVLWVGTSTTTQKYPQLGFSAAKVARAQWQSDATGPFTCTGTTATNGFPSVVSCTKVTNAKALFLNGVQEGATENTAVGTIASMTRLRVGGNGANTPTFVGPIALLCLCKGGMTATQQQAIERFAARLVGAGYQL